MPMRLGKCGVSAANKSSAACFPIRSSTAARYLARASGSLTASGNAIRAPLRATSTSSRIPSGLPLRTSSAKPRFLEKKRACDSIAPSFRTCRKGSGPAITTSSSRTHHLYDDRLRHGHHHYVVQIEIRVLRPRLGPRWKLTDDVIAEQRHQVIALGKDHQARSRSDPANDVWHGICMTGERANVGRQLRHNGPHKWLSRRDRLRRCRLRSEASHARGRQRSAEKCPPLHHVDLPQRQSRQNLASGRISALRKSALCADSDRTQRSKIGPYSITSSAIASSPGGKLRPNALAVLRLITNSNLIDWMTGRSAGFSPLRIRP